ncbi:MAG: ABC transporter ATP-binding protein, partial [Erysipelotrichaceae bacterium]|nr:ABC transporter ATP-binding protein [Erysipelotrichaceae bacterium]
MIQNTVWMIHTALKSCPRLLLTAGLITVLDIAFSLAGIYMGPAVIRIIENKEPVSMLLLTIGLFTGALLVTKWLCTYFTGYFVCCRIEARCTIIEEIAFKCSTTSYPNTFKEDFIGLREKAHHSISSSDGAAESIWIVLYSLFKNTAALICCLFILSRLNPILLLICALTCFFSFLANQKTSAWVYQHGDTEMKYLAQIRYIRSRAESAEIAKDIRIFKMQSWMEEIMNKIHRAYRAYRLKVARMYFFSDLAEVLLTMTRTGIVYAVLIWLVLSRQITIADFVLYFAALANFTNWVSDVFFDLADLYKDSLEISIIRAFLDYPEPFDFEQKNGIPKADQYEICLKDVSY